MTVELSENEKNTLLSIARNAIDAAVNQRPLESLDLNILANNLKSTGASFVTITIGGKLRGCIGALEAFQPLAFDVQEHAVAAALEDFRFQPVSLKELPLLNIEISILSPLKPLVYEDGSDLMKKLRPGIDGVLIRDGMNRATFLPQVWEKTTNCEDFLSHLCMKMGAQPDLWQKKHLSVFTYQVDEIKED